ncbi:MAG: 5-oxoprolinase subunit PxpA [Marinobacter sp.]
MGESFGAWTMGQDEEIMPCIDMANIACGFHAADPSIMTRTVQLARDHGVQIGAHPSYHDLVGFGRRSIHHSAEEIRSLIWYQLGALEGICQAHSTRMDYVKPHGALNNDMMRDPAVLEAVMTAVVSYRDALALMIPVTLEATEHRAMADRLGLPLIFEAFADRAYDDQGQLVPRREPGAVHEDSETIIGQALSLATRGGLRTISGNWLTLRADSLCVHGDNIHALAATRAIRHALRDGKAGA